MGKVDDKILDSMTEQLEMFRAERDALLARWPDHTGRAVVEDTDGWGYVEPGRGWVGGFATRVEAVRHAAGLDTPTPGGDGEQR